MGFGTGGKGFPHYLAENLSETSMTMFLKARITALEALQFLRESNRELGKNDFYVIQLGAGDHHPLIQLNLPKGMRKRHIFRIVRKVGLSKNKTPYNEYRETINQIFKIIYNQGGKLLWISTLQGYRFSPIERKRQRKYYRDVFFESKYSSNRRIQILDLNENLSKRLIAKDLIHPSKEGQIFIAQVILNNLDHMMREDLQ